jgi:hypothetical protein
MKKKVHWDALEAEIFVEKTEDLIRVDSLGFMDPINTLSASQISEQPLL